MKKSFTKIVSVVLAVMFAFTAMACFASAETTNNPVCGCNCGCSCSESGSNSGSAGDNVTPFKGARDVYLVLDISGSMSGFPLKNLKVAAKQFCKTMLEDTTGDNRIAIVTYGTKATTYSFSTDYEELAAIIDGFTAKGSTAMYDALMAVKDVNEKYGNADATKHVVVMADGLPNEGAVLSSGMYDSKDSTMYYKYGNAVYSVASGMWYEYDVYSIGFFHNLGGSQLRFGKVLMEDIQNSLYLEVFDADKIVNAFNDIADDILGPDCDYDCGTCVCECADCPCNDVPCDNAGDDGNCACDVDCVCGDNCTCGPDCTCCADNGNDDNNGNENNGNADNNNGGNNNNQFPDIPQTGDSFAGIAAAAVLMMAGIAVVASKKREA